MASCVMASKLIAKLNEGGIQAKVVDEGDLYPFLCGVNVDVDPDTHRCSLAGLYSYHEDCAEYGADPGRSEAEVLGVTFSTSILYAYDDDVRIDGDVDYDGGLTKEDVIAAAVSGIDFPGYSADDYPFRESKVTDEEIAECLEMSLDDDDIFAKDKDGNVYQYVDRSDVPKGLRVLSRDAAIKQLAHKRPDIVYDMA